MLPTVLSQHIKEDCMGRVKLILFDWNGTLLNDTMAVTWPSVKALFADFSIPPPDMLTFMKEVQEADGNYVVPLRSRGAEVSTEEFRERYADYYTERMEHARLFNDVIPTFNELVSKDVQLGLVTAQRSHLINPFLKKYGLMRYFSCLETEQVDKTGAINWIVGMSHFRAEECWYVGDQPSDVRYAQKAQVVSIALLTDGIDEHLFDATEPDFIIRKLGELIELI